MAKPEPMKGLFLLLCVGIAGAARRMVVDDGRVLEVWPLREALSTGRGKQSSTEKAPCVSSGKPLRWISEEGTNISFFEDWTFTMMLNGTESSGSLSFTTRELIEGQAPKPAHENLTDGVQYWDPSPKNSSLTITYEFFKQQTTLAIVEKPIVIPERSALVTISVEGFVVEVSLTLSVNTIQNRV